jgi:flagellar basal-body rod protein FlgF
MPDWRITGSMDSGLYIAASGMLAEQVRQNQLSNDLSNASTPGYKVDHAEQESFGSLLMSNTATGQPIGSLATGVKIGKISTDLTPSTLEQTGQPLDFGIAGNGFFALRTPQGTRYTRDGQFQANAQGRLVDSQGNEVLSQNGAPIAVSPNGTVSGSALGVFNVSNSAKQGENLYTGSAAGGANGTVHQGELESSGVDPVQTMTDMIASLRTYETGQNAINAISETMQQSAQQVGSIGGG